MTTAAFEQKKHEYPPAEQKQALRRAVRWQLFTIGYTICTIVVVALVMGNSQAMKTAWIEDMLSLLPQLAFLVSILVVRRKATRRHPYGWHRAVGVGHLIAGVALLAVGGMLGFEAVSGSSRQRRRPSAPLTSSAIRSGSDGAVAVMLLIIVGPLIYGPAKLKLAPVLHNKVLYADADMAKADWHTKAASIVGVLGIGLGLWWLDGAAATFIALGIMADGVRNAMAALADLMDQRARTVDGKQPHPLADEILECTRAASWVADAAVRIRDEGQVLHAEVFVKPKRTRSLSSRWALWSRRSQTSTGRCTMLSSFLLASCPTWQTMAGPETERIGSTSIECGCQGHAAHRQTAYAQV